MRELRAENQAFPVIQPPLVEPGLKPPRTARAAKEPSEPPNLAEIRAHEARSSVTAKSHPPKSQEPGRDLQIDLVANPPLKQRGQTTAKAKSTANKSKKAASTPGTKAAWDTSKQLILDRFRQLERECGEIKSQAEELNQQSTAIQLEMAELRSIAHQAMLPPLKPPSAQTRSAHFAPPPLKPAKTGKVDASEPPKVVCADVESVVTPKTRNAVVRKYAPIGLDRSSGIPPTPHGQPDLRGTPVPQKVRAIAHAGYGAADRPTDLGQRQRGLSAPLAIRPGSPSLQTRHSSGWELLQGILRSVEQRLRAIPRSRWAIAMEALTLVFGAMGVRIGLRLLVANFPIISGVVSFLILLPAATAIYLALFQPKTGPVAIYRLVLVTLGLLLGGKV